ILRDARTPALLVGTSTTCVAPQDEGGPETSPHRLSRPAPKKGAAVRALGGDRARCRIIPIHNVKQRSPLRSRDAFSRPVFACLCSIHPHEGRAERRKARYFCCRAFRRATGRAWRGAARVQRDALASRRSTVAIYWRK